MNKGKMNLQQFADRYGLQVKDSSVEGAYGELYTQAKLAIEAISLQYTAPAGEIKAKQDRRALLIVKKADGWYVADKAGPFKTRELARMARERLKNNQ